MVTSRSAALPLRTLAMMSVALAVQAKGSGLSFRKPVQASMVSARSSVDPKLVLVSTRRVRIENQVSMRFSQEDEVGVK